MPDEGKIAIRDKAGEIVGYGEMQLIQPDIPDLQLPRFVFDTGGLELAPGTYTLCPLMETNKCPKNSTTNSSAKRARKA